MAKFLRQRELELVVEKAVRELRNENVSRASRRCLHSTRARTFEIHTSQDDDYDNENLATKSDKPTWRSYTNICLYPKKTYKFEN
ncbi:hypothetical protein FQA39_LY16240 [Lamprigera yunnana]|nr:hypothetical protein FQA39_LY16240 [Lamprigera yunnana]